ncbi:hypothetical protein EOPP23_03000 [Endozoicomonas sp. OPT23]|nr:hypothetical protein [Endozoicomonas sp. OPT23]
MSTEEVLITTYKIQSMTWTNEPTEISPYISALKRQKNSDPVLLEWLEKRSLMLSEKRQLDHFSNETYQANQNTFETLQYHLQASLKNSHPVNDINLKTSLKLLDLILLYSFLSGDEDSKELLGMYPFAEEAISDIDRLFESPTSEMKKVRHIWKYIRTGLVSGRYREANAIQRYGFDMVEGLLSLK